MRKIKWIILFSLLGTFSGCWHNLKINGKKQFFLPHETVEIKVTAKSDMRFFYILTIKSTKGDVEVQPNKLRLVSIPIADTIRISGIYYEKECITQFFKLSRGKTLECKFSVYPKTRNSFITNEIHILPGDFITYQGTSLINDTIKIGSI